MKRSDYKKIKHFFLNQGNLSIKHPTGSSGFGPLLPNCPYLRVQELRKEVIYLKTCLSGATTELSKVEARELELGQKIEVGKHRPCRDG